MERSKIQALVGLLAFASWVAVLMLGFSEADTTFSSYPTAVPGSERLSIRNPKIHDNPRILCETAQ